MKKELSRRSGVRIAAELMKLLGGRLSAVMLLAVLNGSLGFLCAMGVPIFGAVGIAKALGESIPLSYGAIAALCVEGKLVSSEDLADLIARQAVGGAGDMAFVIGSSHGLSPEVKQAAAFRISLGRITLPHQLARLVLTEQLYRAFSINNHGKYHK